MNDELTIFLRPPEHKDLEILFNWENNADFNQFSSHKNSYSKEEIAAFIRTNKNIRENKQFRLMICEQSSKKCLGTVDLYDIDPSKKEAGIGILIAEEHDRKNGYASQALALAEVFAREKLSLKSLFCEIGVDNTPSIGLFEKAGYKSKTFIKNKYIIDSVPVDVYFYSKNI